MQVIVQVSPELSKALRQEPPEVDTPEILELAREFGVPLLPQHGEDDAHLATFFFVEVPDDKVEAFRTRAAACKDVDAAYAKPMDELP